MSQHGDPSAALAGNCFHASHRSVARGMSLDNGTTLQSRSKRLMASSLRVRVLAIIIRRKRMMGSGEDDDAQRVAVNSTDMLQWPAHP